MSKNMYYTYLIGWKQLNKWYYGVRYANNSNPSELWISYKTSSKAVREFYELNGNPDVIQVRKTFDDKLKARNWEHKVLRRIKAARSEKFLNKTDNKSIILTKEDHLKIAQKHIGMKRSEETKLKMRKPKSELAKLRMSIAKKELAKKKPIGYAFYNPASDPEVRKKMSLAKIGVYDGAKNPNSKKIKYNERVFGTLVEFADYVGKSKYLANKMINSGLAEVVI